MKDVEFHAWFAGFVAALGEGKTPDPDQWKAICARVAIVKPSLQGFFPNTVGVRGGFSQNQVGSL